MEVAKFSLVIHLKWLAKFKLRGPGLYIWSAKLILVCCTRTLLYAKMLKETETEETLGLVVFIFIIGDISIGGTGVLAHTPATPMII